MAMSQPLVVGDKFVRLSVCYVSELFKTAHAHSCIEPLSRGGLFTGRLDIKGLLCGWCGCVVCYGVCVVDVVMGVGVVCGACGRCGMCVVCDMCVVCRMLCVWCIVYGLFV